MISQKTPKEKTGGINYMVTILIQLAKQNINSYIRSLVRKRGFKE